MLSACEICACSGSAEVFGHPDLPEQGNQPFHSPAFQAKIFRVEESRAEPQHMGNRLDAITIEFAQARPRAILVKIAQKRLDLMKVASCTIRLIKSLIVIGLPARIWKCDL